MRPETLNGQLFEGTIAGGTPQLFPSAPYLTGRAKHPRGFTPERLREVQRATGMDPQRHHNSRSAAVAGVRDTLAASTAPVEHMHGVGLYPNSPVPGPNTAGSYHTAQGGRPQIHLSPGTERTATVLHELGHHVSNVVDQNPHASSYRTRATEPGPTLRGAEEGYAENYADTHFRDRRGRPLEDSRKSLTGHEWHDSYGLTDWQSKGQFQKAFKDKRADSPVVQKTASEDATKRERLLHPIPPGTKNHVFGQERLLDRTTAGGREYDIRGNVLPQKPVWNYVHRDESDPLHDPEQNKLSAKRRQRLDINPHI